MNAGIFYTSRILGIHATRISGQFPLLYDFIVINYKRSFQNETVLIFFCAGYAYCIDRHPNNATGKKLELWQSLEVTEIRILKPKKNIVN